MAEIPRRWRFQIHLSTAVVLMFAAGGLIWANVRERRVATIGRLATQTLNLEKRYLGEIINMSETEFLDSARGSYWFGNRDCYYGWPSDAMYTSAYVGVNKTAETTVFRRNKMQWLTGLVLDLLVALAILFSAAVACEMLIKLRAKSKGA